jgi:PAS domain S-box-containing protein
VNKLTQPLDSAGCASARPFDLRAWLDVFRDDVVFLRVDAEDRIEFISDSARAILDEDPASLHGRNFREIFDVDHRLCTQLQELSDRLLQHDSQDAARCVAQRRDGRYLFFLLRDRELSDGVGLYLGKEVVALDVTRRVEAELWLRQSERKYRRLVEGFRGDYVIYTRDAHGVMTYVSPSIEGVLGYKRDEVVGRNWREIAIFQNGQPPLVHYNNAAEDPTREVKQFVVELNRRDGSACVLDIQEWAICDIDGRCLATEGIAKDVTAARQAEMEVRSLKDDLGRRVAFRTEELQRINEELRASEARYRNVVETQSEFIVRWTPDGRRTFVNEPFCRFLGHPVEELINKSVVPSIHPDDRHRLGEFIASLTPDAPHSVGETRMIASDGSVRWAQWSTQAFFDEHGQPVEFQSVGRDVTELKEAADLLRQKEAHLAHLSRLAVMGEMVAGIAHELSQPLHAATTFAEAARRHLESGRPGAAPSAIECCNEISISIQRTVEIIHRLREFTKASPVNMELLDLNDVVRGAIELMLYEIRRVNARLHVDLADGLPAVEGDRIQVEQVCVNLLKNACDALIGAPPGKGLLRVVTSQAEGRVRLTIEDSGCGLGAADPTRIFDAFYSTKPDGMGMGLSLCKSIAEAHNMQLGFASNRDGPGTTFYVTLPPAATRRT